MVAAIIIAALTRNAIEDSPNHARTGTVKLFAGGRAASCEVCQLDHQQNAVHLGGQNLRI
jgi:hypothetical protein